MAGLPLVIPDFKPFLIGKVMVNSPLILAPMDGISDSPFRSITRELGSALSYTEFINGLDVVGNALNYKKRCEFSETERPVVFQLFDEDPHRMIQATAMLMEKWAPDIIDVNMGCSVRHVVNRGAGAGLLRHPGKIISIVDGLVKLLTIPVTIKIRLGWDAQSKNYLEIGKIAQDYGASAVVLHARTREQMFTDTIDLDAIAKLKQSLFIPVIGNGDVHSIADAKHMFCYTKCDAVMIGRAAISNPWIFSGYDEKDVPKFLFLTTVQKHLRLMKDFYGAERGCVIFRKYAKRYLQKISIPVDEIHPLLMLNDSSEFTRRFTDLVENSDRTQR